MFAFALLPQSGGQVQQIAETFGVDWPHLVAQIISFSIVCILLQRFAYKPVLKMLDHRRQQIADGVAERATIKNELAQTEVKCHELILAADAQAKALIEEARQSAARLQHLESQRAMAAAEQSGVKAREAAAQEHARMLAELKREVGELVIQATTSLM